MHLESSELTRDPTCKGLLRLGARSTICRSVMFAIGCLLLPYELAYPFAAQEDRADGCKGCSFALVWGLPQVHVASNVLQLTAMKLWAPCLPLYVL